MNPNKTLVARAAAMSQCCKGLGPGFPVNSSDTARLYGCFDLFRQGQVCHQLMVLRCDFSWLHNYT